MESPAHWAMNALDIYRVTWGKAWPAEGRTEEDSQEDFWSRFRALLQQTGCFDRSHLPGHFTGSALVATPSLDRVLLTLHAKLNRWLQLGGHADGDPRLDEVAMREAREESGLEELHFLPYGSVFDRPPSDSPIFDLDIHLIPARKTEPEHAHYDARFLIIANRPEAIAISHESHELRWFPIEEAFRVTGERSMHRQFEKLLYLKEKMRTP